MSRQRSLRLTLLAALLFLLAGPLAATSLTGTRGETLTEADLATGTTVAIVWASWSPKCRDVGQRIGAATARWSPKATVISIAFRDEADAARAFQQRQGFEMPVFLDPDGAFAKRHAVTDLPGLLIVRDGAVVSRGPLPEDLDAELAKHL